jgi:hypothetical protein
VLLATIIMCLALSDNVLLKLERCAGGQEIPGKICKEPEV